MEEETQQQKWFITFGGPSDYYRQRVTQISEEARNINVFNHIVGYTDKDLVNDTDFWDKHGEFISTHERGYGYWLWKPYLTQITLENLLDNDILVYADAGCTINPQGFPRLLEYFDIVNKSEHANLSFRTVHLEKTWTKMDTFEYYGAKDNENIFETEQLVGGIYVIRNYNLIDDSPSSIPNDPSFNENRHDQSIFSVVRKKYGTEMTDFDETYFDTDWYGAGIKYPFWATRLKY